MLLVSSRRTKKRLKLLERKPRVDNIESSTILFSYERFSLSALKRSHRDALKKELDTTQTVIKLGESEKRTRKRFSKKTPERGLTQLKRVLDSESQRATSPPSQASEGLYFDNSSCTDSSRNTYSNRLGRENSSWFFIRSSLGGSSGDDEQSQGTKMT